MRKKISIVTPCFNEEGNVEQLYLETKKVMDSFSTKYDYEQIYIDNCSTDNTIPLIKKICSQDKNIKAILNSKNFGHIRSPVYGLYQASGDAVIIMASDFQDPPSLIPQLIKQWENGFEIVKCIKNKSQESSILYLGRGLYYWILKKISKISLTSQFTGFGLYYKKIITELKKINDPYPYFRGLIEEIGFNSTQIYFTQPLRNRGISKNNFYSLYDMAMLGFVSYSKVPLRFMTFSGFLLSILSFSCGILFLILKLFYWDRYQAGIIPILILVLFCFSVQMLCLGLIGEYIGFIHTYSQKRPLIIERERINFL